LSDVHKGFTEKKTCQSFAESSWTDEMEPKNCLTNGWIV